MSDNIQPDPQSAPPTSALHEDYETQHARMLAAAKMIRFSTVIAGMIAMAVILSAIGIAIIQVVKDKNPNDFVMPDVLRDWGGVILGFYYGQFVTVLKDFMG